MNTPELSIRVQPTPNPNALKFILNQPLKSHGKATFTKPSEAFGVRLAEDLFALEDVRQLHLFENVLTVTLAVDADLDTCELEVRSVLNTRMPIHDPHFLTDAEKEKTKKKDLPENLKQIDQILDESVRMFLQGDGGDIELIKLEDKKLYVRYQGACGTCPSSTSATLEAIQGIVRDKFDPEIEVIPV